MLIQCSSLEFPLIVFYPWSCTGFSSSATLLISIKLMIDIMKPMYLLFPQSFKILCAFPKNHVFTNTFTVLWHIFQLGWPFYWPEWKNLPELQTAEKSYLESHPTFYAGNSFSVNVASYHFTFQCNLLELLAHMKLIINIQIFYILLVLSHIFPVSHCSVIFNTDGRLYTYPSYILSCDICSSCQPAMNLLSWFHNPIFLFF